MNKLLLLPPLLLISCGSLITSKTPKEGKRNYSYVDVAGKFSLSREQKLLKNKVITRSVLASDIGSTLKPLEKSVMVSQLGSIKTGRTRALSIRPYASEFTVWLEGKKYSSKMKLDPQKQSMLLELDSPEDKWKGTKAIPVPRGKHFCFFSQIPECLYHNLYLARTLNNRQSLTFYVVWESYPYIQELLSHVGHRLFSPASIMFEGEYGKILRYQVEVDGQTIQYHFSKSFDLVKIFWVAQGISIVPLGQEIVAE